MVRHDLAWMCTEAGLSAAFAETLQVFHKSTSRSSNEIAGFMNMDEFMCVWMRRWAGHRQGKCMGKERHAHAHFGTSSWVGMCTWNGHMRMHYWCVYERSLRGQSEDVTLELLAECSLAERREILRSMGLRFGQIMAVMDIFIFAL